MKFLQINLGRGKGAQDLLMQTARERGADVLLIREQHKWSKNSAWYQDASRRAGILVLSPHLSIGDFLETDGGSFGSRWRRHLCTAATSLPTILSRFSRPRSSSLRKASEKLGGALITGDFKSKSPEWGEARLDRRGILVGEMAAGNDLIVLNRGRDFTFRRGAGGSIIDLTFAAPRLVPR